MPVDEKVINASILVDESFFKIYEGSSLRYEAKYESSIDGRFSCYLEDLENDLISLVLSINGRSFPSGVHIWGDLDDFGFIDIKRVDGSSKTMVFMPMDIDLKEWSQPFSVKDFIDRYIGIVHEKSYSATHEDIHDSIAFTSFCVEVEDDEVLGGALARLNGYANKLYQETLVKMNKDIQGKILLKVFDFPEGYQSICVQYLVWFGELLTDLGISADIYTEQNGNKTRAIIAPENASEVLEEVEKLFYTYLCLPYCELLPAIPQSAKDQFLLTNLQAQVNHFQTQVQLKDAALELKNATISSLQSVIDKQSEELLLLNSLNEEELSFFNGAVKIGDITWGPVKISPKKLLPK